MMFSGMGAAVSAVVLVHPCCPDDCGYDEPCYGGEAAEVDEDAGENGAEGVADTAAGGED